MQRWSVRLFAHLRARHGETVEVEAAPLAGDLLRALKDAGIATDACRLAVNLEFVEPDRALEPFDEIALIPPVSGG